MKEYSKRIFRIFKIRSVILPALVSFALSSSIMCFYPRTIGIFSLIGLLVTFFGAIFVAISVFSCPDEVRSVNGSGSRNKIFPLALINPGLADKGIRIMFFGFGIQLGYEFIRIIVT